MQKKLGNEKKYQSRFVWFTDTTVNWSKGTSKCSEFKSFVLTSFIAVSPSLPKFGSKRRNADSSLSLVSENYKQTLDLVVTSDRDAWIQGLRLLVDLPISESSYW
jgi:hypothetical protein